MCRARLVVLAVLAAALALPGVARAQLYVVDHFDNANSSLPDGTVRITNVGTVPGTPVPGVGDQCALIYVWDPGQDLVACCGCRITPNGLIKLSVNKNLTSNAITGIAPTSGTIVLVPSAPNAAVLPAPAGSDAGCNPGVPPIQAVFNANVPISAWSTHIQDSGATTEGNFIAGINNSAVNGDFSPAQTTALAAKCSIVTTVGGSNVKGLCNCTGEVPAVLDPPPLPLVPPLPL
jgi:hypothetical protein